MSKQKKIKLVRIVRSSVEKLIADEVRAAISTSDNREKFDMKYLERVAQNCVDLEKRKWRLQILNVVLVIFLLSHMLTGGSDFSVLGVSLNNLPQIREFLLIVIVSIEASSGVINQTEKEINIVQETILESLFPDSSERKVWKAGLPTFWGHIDLGNVKRTKLSYTLTGLFLFLIPKLAYVFLIGIFVLAYYGIIVMVWWQIFQTPNFSEFWNAVILFYTGVGIIGSLFLAISRKIEVPFKDLSTVYALQQLRKTNKDAYQALVDEILREHENSTKGKQC